jgi:hypothetical protein
MLTALTAALDSAVFSAWFWCCCSCFGSLAAYDERATVALARMRGRAGQCVLVRLKAGYKGGV